MAQQSRPTPRRFPPSWRLAAVAALLASGLSFLNCGPHAREVTLVVECHRPPET